MMKNLRALTILFVFASVTLSVKASAQITVSDAYAKTTFAMATTGAVYLTLDNHSNIERKLTAVHVGKELADKAQIHTTKMVGEMAKMREVKEGVKLAPHQTITFMPGGHHIMLIGLKKPLIEGNTIPITLSFDDGQSQTVEVTVRKENEKSTPETHNRHNHH